MIEQEMKELLRNLAVYFIYVGIVFIISYGNRDPNAYREKLALQQVPLFDLFGGSTRLIVKGSLLLGPQLKTQDSADDHNCLTPELLSTTKFHWLQVLRDMK